MSEEAAPEATPTPVAAPTETPSDAPAEQAPAEEVAAATGNANLGESLNQIPASQVMEKDFPTIAIEKSVGDAYDLMVERKVECLPILQDGKVVRMVSKNNIEIMRSVYFDAPGLEERQSRVMCLALANVSQSQKLISATADKTLKDIAQLMAKNAIHSIPILNEASEFLGMITSLQILNLISV